MALPARVVLRRAAPGDAGSVARLHADSWRRHYRGAYADTFLDGDVESDRLQVWAERLSAPEATASTILAEDEGRVVGFVHVIFDDDAQYGSLIDNLHVAFDRKRAGIGTQLMSQAAAAVLGREAGGLYLWVFEQNTAAQTFYEARGGRPTGRRRVSDTAEQLNGSPVVLRYAWSDPAILIV